MSSINKLVTKGNQATGQWRLNKKSNMQVNILVSALSNRVMRDIDYMQEALDQIYKDFNKIDTGTATSSTYESLLQSVSRIKDRIDLVDNANDFYKIDGFAVLPRLLSSTKSEIQAASADLIAELVQNNLYGQCKLLESNIPEQLLGLLKKTENAPVCLKALYALSCLCRHNHAASIWFEKSGGLLILLDILQVPIERLQVKAAFLLSCLVTHEEFIRRTLPNTELIPKLINLLEENEGAGQEYILNTLVTLVKLQDSSKALCSQSVSLKNVLKNKVELYADLPEHWESKNYCIELLAECFNY